LLIIWPERFVEPWAFQTLNDWDRRERFQNEVIIAAHLSTRYHSKTVRALVERAIPDMLEGRLHLWL
jgi:ribonuclease Z